MTVDDEVTGVTVCYNTKEILKKAIDSIRSFHPGMKLIIVDGSDKTNDCYKYVCSLPDERTRVFHVDFNIGHGRGLALGISFVDTPFFLTFDSDIEMLKSPLQAMLDMMKEDTYGVGYCERTGYDGFDYGAHRIHLKQKPVKYLHPYFMLIQISQYKKFKPFIHHGAPCISAMLDIHKKGLSDKILLEFPDLGHTSGMGLSWKPCAGKYIMHDVAAFGGTGRMRREMGLPHIEGEWERVIV